VEEGDTLSPGRISISSPSSRSILRDHVLTLELKDEESKRISGFKARSSSTSTLNKEEWIQVSNNKYINKDNEEEEKQEHVVVSPRKLLSPLSLPGSTSPRNRLLSPRRSQSQQAAEGGEGENDEGTVYNDKAGLEGRRPSTLSTLSHSSRRGSSTSPKFLGKDSIKLRRLSRQKSVCSRKASRLEPILEEPNMGLLRSEPMCSGTLVLPNNRARFFMDHIGRNMNVQFLDMHRHRTSPVRPYKKFIQRIDEIERLLRWLFTEISASNRKIVESSIENFLRHDHYYKLETVETSVKNAHQRFERAKENNKGMLLAQQQATEERYVLHASAHSSTAGSSKESIFSRLKGARRRSSSSSANSLGYIDTEHGVATTNDSPIQHSGAAFFSQIAGVVPLADQERFARFVFRSTRGNAFTHFDQIPDPIFDRTTGKRVKKSVFAVHFQDRQAPSRQMHDHIMRICTQFGVNIYSWVTNPKESSKKIRQLDALLDEKKIATEAYERVVGDIIATLIEKTVSGNSLIEDWRLFCAKEKANYATLNLFEGNTTLRCDLWYPAKDEDQLQRLLTQHSLGDSFASLVADKGVGLSPPTYFKTNELTGPMQTLIHTYGIPRYREISPVSFTVVTFPFLFGVMFGDVGHGLMLLGAGFYLVHKEDVLINTQPILYQGRYTICMMGFFSIFAGLMYSEFFSLGINLFGSRWKHVPGQEEMVPLYDIKNGLDPMMKFYPFDNPYPLGLDPAWHGAINELNFVNSMKMKISVILGITQMCFGLFIRCMNAWNERNYIDFFGECVPMLMWFFCFFCYMDYMIIYKWVNVYPAPGPPSIIGNLISMVLFSDLPTGNDSDGVEVPIELFPDEKELEINLMYYLLVSAPALFFIKPLLLWYQSRNIPTSKRKIKKAYTSLEQEDLHDDPNDKYHKPHIDMGEIMMHQAIEAIEFLLGSVSHAASYLRLWALSLAHQQLSSVLFQYVIIGTMCRGTIATYIGFALWLGYSTYQFLCIGVLEVILHTMRLHWVEFMGTFYRGDGYLFEPFSFLTTLKQVREAE